MWGFNENLPTYPKASFQLKVMCCFFTQTGKLADVHMQQDSNSEENMPSPTTTFSHTSIGSFSHAGSFGQTSTQLFITQHRNLKTSSGALAVALNTKTLRDDSRDAAASEFTPSPVIQRVSFHEADTSNMGVSILEGVPANGGGVEDR